MQISKDIITGKFNKIMADIHTDKTHTVSVLTDTSPAFIRFYSEKHNVYENFRIEAFEEIKRDERHKLVSEKYWSVLAPSNHSKKELTKKLTTEVVTFLKGLGEE